MKKVISVLVLIAGLGLANAAPALNPVYAQEVSGEGEGTIEQAIYYAADVWNVSSAVLFQEYGDGIVTVTVTETEINVTRAIAGGSMMILIIDDASF